MAEELTPARRRAGPTKRLSPTKLDGLIEEAIADAFGESEQTSAFYTMISECLTTPFQTEVLGMEVTVRRVEMTDDGRVVALCTRGKYRQRMAILDLPLPDPPPEGAEWIAAYRRWIHGR